MSTDDPCYLHWVSQHKSWEYRNLKSNYAQRSEKKKLQKQSLDNIIVKCTWPEHPCQNPETRKMEHRSLQQKPAYKNLMN